MITTEINSRARSGAGVEASGTGIANMFLARRWVVWREGSRMNRKRLLLVLGSAIALGVALGPWARAQGPPGGLEAVPAAPATPQMTPTIAFAAGGDQWYWLRVVGDERELWERPRNGAERRVAAGAAWEELAPGPDGSVWLLQREEGRGSLLQATADGSVATVLADLSHPGGLYLHREPDAPNASGDRVFWLERDAREDSGLDFIPSAGTQLSVRVRHTNGDAGTLCTVPTSMTYSPVAGDILGVLGEDLYFRVRRALSTEFYRVALSGAEPHRVTLAADAQTGILHDGALYWTAPSEEAMPSAFLACVRRMDPSGDVTLAADWLPAYGTLLSAGGKIYYARDELEQLSGGQDFPQFIGRILHPPASTDGRSVVLLGQAEGPTLFKPTRR
jgi:hypothetical protein